MEAIAKANYARYSPRKVGQVLGLVRGQTVEKAYRLLPNIPRSAAVLVFKTIKSAFSNSGSVDPSQIYVSKAWVNQGPTLKRVRPMAMGGRGLIKRKSCHVTIVVSDQKPVTKKKKR